MTLSEHEERELQEIARRLAQEDPEFVATVSETTITSVGLRRLRWSAAAFTLGLVTLLGLTFHFAFGLIGFGLMLGAAIAGVRSVRELAPHGGDILQQLRRRG
ncbi:MAG: DUF3040 domain-containing protein [Nitriliruptorales bacterium]